MNSRLHWRIILPIVLSSFFFFPACGKQGTPHQSTAASSSNSQTEASSSPPRVKSAAPDSASPEGAALPPPCATVECAHEIHKAPRVGTSHAGATRNHYLISEPHIEGSPVAAGGMPHHISSPPPVVASSPPPIAPPYAVTPTPALSPPPFDKNYAVVGVFYATDRWPTGDNAPANIYGGDRQPDESLHLGTVDVSIPRDHRMGDIERPSIWSLQFREDPEKNVVLMGVAPQSEQEFYAELTTKVKLSAKKDAFVFIHGFDNTFEQAAWRTAQLSYDLGFQGAAIMYSWPSKGKLAEYAADEATIDWTTPHLQRFLEALATRSHATTIHLIAHSMGNRALTRALYAIAQNQADILPMFKHVFLAAPDIDVGVFRQLAATFPSTANDITLYASSRDEAIVASEKIHQFDRAGDSTHICVVPRIDTIDASAVDTGLIGHAYFGDNRSILTDMFEIMQNGSPPGRRFGMHAATMQQMTYWILSP